MTPPGPRGEECLSPELEARLIAGVKAGDPDALARLFQAYHPPLCTFAERMLGAPSEAEDVVIDVFARIWEAREDWEIRSTARAYLYQAVRNRAIGRLRHRQVVTDAHARFRADPSPPTRGRSPPAPDEALAASELQEAIREEIARLPPRCREAFTHHRWDGLTYAEIAEIMGVSVRTVENQIAHALRLLRERLADRHFAEG